MFGDRLAWPLVVAALLVIAYLPLLTGFMHHDQVGLNLLVDTIPRCQLP
jgi:hypothetical protein